MLSNNSSRIGHLVLRPTFSLKTTARPSIEKSPEAPLQFSFATFRLLFETSSYPMWVHDVKTRRFLAINEAAIRNYLYSRDEFAAMTVDQLYPAQQSASCTNYLKNISPERDPSSTRLHARKDGTTLTVAVTSHEMIFDGRKAQLVLAMNIGGRQQSKRTLQEAEDRYRDLFDHSNDIVFTADLDGRLTSLNKAGETAVGWSPAEAAIGQSAQIPPSRSQNLARIMRDRKSLEGGETSYELEIPRKDGRPLTLAVRTCLTFANGKPSGVRGIARDITAVQQLEERLRRSQKMEALGLLAGGIAHDFNNLLGVIIGYGEALSDRSKLGDPSHRYAAEVLKAGQRAAALTSQLLAFSRQQVLQPKVLNLNAAVTNMEQLLQRLIREDIEMIFKLDPQLGQVKADPGQIEQVIMNLAVNARDAMPQGGELRIATANVEVDETGEHRDAGIPPGSYVALTVGDTGLGMDEKTKASIFEPFFTTKQSGKGTGLGLPTVYGIVKQGGGSIAVQSQPGKGSTFMVYLPRVEEPVTNLTSGGDRTSPQTGTETILLVDDAEPFRKLVRMVLESGGYTVLEACTSSEAAQLGAIHQGPIDLLLTDVVMPKVDGYQLSDYLRFHRPEMKVLYMSGYADSASVRETGHNLGTQVLPKPFRKDAVLLVVRQMLDERQDQNSLFVPQQLLNGVVQQRCR